MGKNPASQFYWGDWLNDVELQAATSATRGIWANALARMWYSRTKGEIVGTPQKLTQTLNCTLTEIGAFLEEAQTLLFCYMSRNDNGEIILRNRRMYREAKDKEFNRLRQEKHREKRKNNVKITPPSSSSSSSSTSKTKDIKRFIVPTFVEIKDYCKERKNQINAQTFIDHYTSNGWLVGKNKMKDWKAAVRTWEQRNYGGTPMSAPMGTPKKEKPFVKCPKCGESKYTELIEYRKGVFLCPDCLKDADPEIPDKLKELMSKIGGV